MESSQENILKLLLHCVKKSIPSIKMLEYVCQIILNNCKNLCFTIKIYFFSICKDVAPCRDEYLLSYMWNRFVTAEDTNISLGIFWLQNNSIFRSIDLDSWKHKSPLGVYHKYLSWSLRLKVSVSDPVANVCLVLEYSYLQLY